MRLRIPTPYTVLITRTGETPFTISFRPLPIIVLSLVLAAFPILWVVRLVNQNEQLTERNQDLTETANEVLIELETLDSEVEDLRERAGLPEDTLPETNSRVERPRGGMHHTASAEDLFTLAKSRLPQIGSQLNAKVRPALEDTLAEEAARAAALPSAEPLDGPLDVSSKFGLRRNPFGGFSYEMHSGIDFRGPIGKPVYATAAGVVAKAQSNGGYGKHIVIDHGYGYKTLYAHLSAIEVNAGDRLQRGDVIGALGSTGRSSGPHLHYEVHRDGQPINPQYYLELND